MKIFTRPTAALLLLVLSTFLTTATVAQQKRQTPAKPQPKAAPTPAPTPVPTFDTLIPADSYNIYGEVRGVGQLIRSGPVVDILDPILKLGAPPKEFKTLVQWLNAHAEELMTSRLLVAAWPTAKDVPEVVIAIEFASTEEATKFAAPLNQFLPKILPPIPAETPESKDDKSPAGEKTKPAAPATPPGPPKPSYYLQQSGSLILLSQTPLNLKKLKPAGSKLLSDDINFRAARNRFNSEPVFVFVDMKSIQKQEQEQRKRVEEEMRAQGELVRKEKAAASPEPIPTEGPSPEEIAEQERALLEAEENARLQQTNPLAPGTAIVSPEGVPDPSMAFMMFVSAFYGFESKWPEGIGLALNLENESFDVRALLVNQPGEKSDAVPFVPMLIPAQPYVPESPNVLPADSELLITMSLDLPQIYTAMSKPRTTSFVTMSPSNAQRVREEVQEPPFAALEKKLQLNLKDDVFPMVGPEVALRLPVKDFNLFGLVRQGGQKPIDEKAAATAAPLLLISLRDKEGVRAFMPKLVEAMGFKGANQFAQTERREDTEIVTYAGFFSYAFAGNFLLLAGDPATIRHAVDSYLKHETLASDSQFKNFTRWQPKPMHGQVYVSSALMESYRDWLKLPSTRLGDQTKAFLTRLTEVPQPITYSLSNEGLGPFHELRVPRNLVLMAVAGLSGETNPPPSLVNERAAMGMLHQVAYAQQRYKEEKGKGVYGTLEQLIAEELLSEDSLKLTGYKLDLTVTGDKFEATAVPLEYGKSGTMSYFIDETFIIRGGDRNGGSASSSDPPIY